MKNPKIILLVGNIGTGKTTLAKKYAKQGYIVVARDSLRYMIGAGKYIFNLDLESAIWQTELDMVENFMALKQNLIIDEVGINESMRYKYIELAIKYFYTITSIELPRLSKKVAVDRRMKNPHQQHDRKLWEGIWEKFDKLYEEPTTKEGIHKIIRLKTKGVK